MSEGSSGNRYAGPILAAVVLVVGMAAIFIPRMRSGDSVDGAAANMSTPSAAPGLVSEAPQATTAAADELFLAAHTITVYKSPTCGCCTKWIEHLEASGMTVVAVNKPDMTPTKRENGVPVELESCHTARVGDYVIEGHVPAADIARLLREKPEVVGLAVPGMPMGSPGMEGPVKDAYSVLAFLKDGKTSVFSNR